MTIERKLTIRAVRGIQAANGLAWFRSHYRLIGEETLSFDGQTLTVQIYEVTL